MSPLDTQVSTPVSRPEGESMPLNLLPTVPSAVFGPVKVLACLANPWLSRPLHRDTDTFRSAIIL